MSTRTCTYPHPPAPGRAPSVPAEGAAGRRSCSCPAAGHSPSTGGLRGALPPPAARRRNQGPRAGPRRSHASADTQVIFFFLIYFSPSKTSFKRLRARAPAHPLRCGQHSAFKRLAEGIPQEAQAAQRGSASRTDPKTNARNLPQQPPSTATASHGGAPSPCHTAHERAPRGPSPPRLLK